ncbi:hypothetical protein V6Z11_D13G060600 [Gossypium hirsutum]
MAQRGRANYEIFSFKIILFLFSKRKAVSLVFFNPLFGRHLTVRQGPDCDGDGTGSTTSAIRYVLEERHLRRCGVRRGARRGSSCGARLLVAAGAEAATALKQKGLGFLHWARVNVIGLNFWV